MGEHAILSPSASHRWIECPGSIRLCAGTEETSSVYAEEGTFAHDIAATCLEQNIDAVEMVGKTDGVFTCDFPMAEALQVYLDVVREIMADRHEPRILIEQKVTVTKDCWGTGDAVIWTPGRIDVVDLKYGSGLFVEAENNPQLRVYGLGALRYMEKLGFDNVHTVTCHIVQPRYETPEGPHRFEKLDVNKLKGWGNAVLSPAIRATRKSDAPLSAGDHCRFCDAKPICPKLREVVQTRTREVFATRTVPDPSGLAPEQIAEILDVAPLVEAWLKSVRAHAYQQANHGHKIPGYKLVRKMTNRKWKDEEEAHDVLSCYIDPDAPTKTVSPAQAEKLLPKGYKFVVYDLAEKPEGGTTLVPNSDKRDAVSASSPFGILPSESESD